MKFVIILNRNITIAQALNATSYMMAALIENMLPEWRRILGMTDYKDADNNSHYASKWPQAILKADNSNQIRKIREVALGMSLNFVDFTNAMTGGTYHQLIEKSKNTKEIDLEYYGAAMFGPLAELEEITEKYAFY